MVIRVDGWMGAGDHKRKGCGVSGPTTHTRYLGEKPPNLVVK